MKKDLKFEEAMLEDFKSMSNEERNAFVKGFMFAKPSLSEREKVQLKRLMR